ncbi:MAG: hypothetical protein ACPGJS_08315 [Flammeovirgaceae bacterium]
MSLAKYIQKLFCCTTVLVLFVAYGYAKPYADELEGNYLDNTHSEPIVLVIKRITNTEVLISDPEGDFIPKPIRVSILEKKVNDLAGMTISNYITSNKNIRISKINGAITLSVFTSTKAFVGKKKQITNNQRIDYQLYVPNRLK